MGSIALGGRVAYAVDRLWEGLRRETICKQDLERLGILLDRLLFAKRFDRDVSFRVVESVLEERSP